MVWDDDGNAYLDLVAGIAVNALGHAHPAVVQAVSTQVATLGHTSNLVANEPSLRLAERLLALHRPGRSGLLRQLRRRGERGRLQDGAADRAPVRGGRRGRLPRPHDGRARRSPGSRPSARRSSRCPAASRSCRTATPRRCGRRWTTGRPRCSSSRCSARAASSRPRRATWRPPGRSTRQHGALLVLDEVQTGIGRTGAWFAHQRGRASSPTSSPSRRGWAAACRSAPASPSGTPRACSRPASTARRSAATRCPAPRPSRCSTRSRTRACWRAGRAAREGRSPPASRGSATRWSTRCGAPG